MPWFTQSHGWRSGPWSLALRGDELADISYDATPVLRSIRAVVRDRDWNTAPLIVDRVSESEATLTLHVRSEGFGSSFRGVVRAEVRPTALVVITDLESEAAFATNRTGLVVLHPPETSGAALTVTHPDGATEATALPLAISAHQPVFDIAGLAWHHAGLDVSTAFDGDVFEMEDQRNWTDASFKTYSRPLSLPFPYSIAPGDRVRQTITVRAIASEQKAAPEAGAEPTPRSIDHITLAPGGAFPRIGVGAASAPDPAPASDEVGAFVLVELDLSSTNWRAALARAAEGPLPLDVRFVLDADHPEALSRGVDALHGVDVVRVAAFHQVSDARHVSDREAVAALREALRAARLDVPVVGGSRSHFTELNREFHRLPDDLDGLAVTVTPLFHALGTEQLVESVAMQRLVALQSVSMAGDVPVHIGPVTLRPRFNDVATARQPAPTRDDLVDGYGAEFTGIDDDRQSAPELAAWTVASAAALATPGVASLSWFEQWGPRGIRSASGTPLPVSAAIRSLAELESKDGERLVGDSPDGLVWALGVRTPNGSDILAANLDTRPRALTVTTPDGPASTVVAPSSFIRLTPDKIIQEFP